MEQKIEKPEPLKGFLGYFMTEIVINEITPEKNKFIFYFLKMQELTSHIDFNNAEIWRIARKNKFVVFYKDAILFIDGNWLFINEVKEIKYKDIRSVDFKFEPFNKEKSEQLQIAINYGNKKHKLGLTNHKYNMKFAKYLKQKIESKQLSSENDV